MAQYFARFDKSQAAVLQAIGREIADFATEVDGILQRMPPAPSILSKKFQGTDWQATNTKIRGRLQQFSNLLMDESNAFLYAMSVMEATESGRVSLSSIVSPTFTADIAKLSGDVIVMVPIPAVASTTAPRSTSWFRRTLQGAWQLTSNTVSNIGNVVVSTAQSAWQWTSDTTVNIGNSVASVAIAGGNWFVNIIESQPFKETIKTIKGALELAKMIVGPAATVGGAIGSIFPGPGNIIGAVVGAGVGILASVGLSFLVNTTIGNNIVNVTANAVTSGAVAAFNWTVNAASTVGNVIASASQSAWNFATNTAQTVGTAVTSGAQSAWNFATNTAQAVGTAVASGAQSAWNFASNTASNVANTAANLGNAALNTLQNVGSAAVSGAQNVTNAAITGVQNVGNAIASGAQNVGNALMGGAQSFGRLVTSW